MNDVIEKIYHLESISEPRKASIELMRFININYTDPDIINEFMKQIDINKLQTHSIVGLVRFTFNIKHLLSEWDNIYYSSKLLLQSRSKDTARLFVGLPDA